MYILLYSISHLFNYIVHFLLLSFFCFFLFFAAVANKQRNTGSDSVSELLVNSEEKGLQERLT